MKTDHRKVLGNAVVWAAMMITTSLLVGESEQAGFLLLLMIAGWYATHLGLTTSRESVAREWACLKRRFQRTTE